MILVKLVHLDSGTMTIASTTCAEWESEEVHFFIIHVFSVDRETPTELTSHFASRGVVLEVARI